jgi:capsular polysaccharide biosynthesis protein
MCARPADSALQYSIRSATFVPRRLLTLRNQATIILVPALAGARSGVRSPSPILKSKLILEITPGPRLDDLLVIDYLNALWRQRWAIVTVMLCFLIAAAVWNAQSTRVFEATVTLVPSPPRPSEPPGPRTPVRALVQNQTIANELIRPLHLDQPPHSLTPQSFARDHVIVDETTVPGVVRVSVRLTDAAAAAEAANRLVDMALALDARTNRTDDDAERERVTRQIEVARQMIKDADDRVMDFLAANKQELTKGSAYRATTARPIASPATSQEIAAFGDAQLAAVPSVYGKEAALRSLEVERDTAVRAYGDLVSKSIAARVQAVNVGSYLHVIDRAAAPDRPASPRALWNLTIAFVSGVIASLLAAFVLELARRLRTMEPIRTPDSAVSPRV